MTVNHELHSHYSMCWENYGSQRTRLSSARNSSASDSNIFNPGAPHERGRHFKSSCFFESPLSPFFIYDTLIYAFLL